MGYEIKNSNAARNLLFLLVQAADHISPLTGATPAVTLSKNGAAFAAPVGEVSEVGNGWYSVAANATDANTSGPLLLHATAESGDPTDEIFQVVAYNPDDAVRLGLTSLPNVICGAAGGVNDVVRFAGATAAVGADNLPKVSLWSILGSALSETVTGYLAAAFKTLFNVASPVFTTASVNQGGDAYAVVNNVNYGNSALTTAIGRPQQSGVAVTLPSMPAGWLTADGIAAGALDGQGDWLPAESYTPPPSAAAVSSAVLSAALTESYAAMGTAPTLAQLLFEMRASICDFAIAGTLISSHTISGTGVAATYSLDSATAPTKRSRTS